MKILTIIPAKMDSTRLKGKNLKMVTKDKTLVEHSIEYAKNSQHEVDIILSSESQEIRQIASKNKTMFHKRHKDLCGDAEVVDVYSKIQCCWVRFFEDYDETKADEECTFLFGEVEVI